MVRWSPGKRPRLSLRNTISSGSSLHSAKTKNVFKIRNDLEMRFKIEIVHTTVLKAVYVEDGETLHVPQPKHTHSSHPQMCTNWIQTPTTSLQYISYYLYFSVSISASPLPMSKKCWGLTFLLPLDLLVPVMPDRSCLWWASGTRGVGSSLKNSFSSEDTTCTSDSCCRSTASPLSHRSLSSLVWTTDPDRRNMPWRCTPGGRKQHKYI